MNKPSQPVASSKPLAPVKTVRASGSIPWRPTANNNAGQDTFTESLMWPASVGSKVITFVSLANGGAK